jgi:hypothetical protein
VNTEQSSNKYDDINNTNVSVYQEMTDSIMVEVQHKYNLRPKKNLCRLLNPRKFFLEVKYMSLPQRRLRYLIEK